MTKLTFGLILLVFGLIATTIGGFLAKDGWDERNKSTTKPSDSSLKILNPKEEKLLSLIYKYQREFGENKIIISRNDGTLFFDDEDKKKKYNINIIGELFGVSKEFQNYSKELEALVLNIPSDYLKQIPENRWDSPFVVTVTSNGIKYIKTNK